MAPEESKLFGRDRVSPERQHQILQSAEACAEAYLKSLVFKFGRKIPPMNLIEAQNRFVFDPTFEEMYLNIDDINNATSPTLTELRIVSEKEKEIFKNKFYSIVVKGYPVDKN